MQLWIDNTGFHSVGRCLSGEARTEYDLKGLLQFATLLAFSESMSIGNYNQPIIAQYSAGIRDQLLDLGLEPTSLRTISLSTHDFVRACEVVAKDVQTDIHFYIGEGSSDRTKATPENAPTGAEFQPERILSALLFREGEDEETVRLAALDKNSPSATVYILLSSPQLRSTVKKISNITDERLLFQLEAYIRYRLNTQIAIQNDGIYAPSVHRAEISRAGLSFIADRLTSTLDDVVSQFAPEPLGMPSVQAFLLQRSKGEPKALISEALQLRERARTLIVDLTQEWRMAISEEHSKHRVNKRVISIRKDLLVALGLDEGSRFVDAISIGLAVGLIPHPSADLVKLVRWAGQERRSARVAALTDVSMSAAYSHDRFLFADKLASRSGLTQ